MPDYYKEIPSLWTRRFLVTGTPTHPAHSPPLAAHPHRLVYCAVYPSPAGSEGYLGSRLVKRLRAMGAACVVGVDVRPGPTTAVVASAGDFECVPQAASARRVLLACVGVRVCVCVCVFDCNDQFGSAAWDSCVCM